MEGEERWQSLADKKIEEAMRRGEFDYSNLKGKKMASIGSDYETDWQAGDQLMANKVLANSGFAPDFIMKKREIEEMLEKERTVLLRDARRRHRLLGSAAGAAPGQAAELSRQAEADWQQGVQRFEEALGRINAEISTFNVMNRIATMHIRRIVLADEVARIEQLIEKS